MGMLYSSAEIDRDLECSYCQTKFVDVIKVVPGCGESICDHCYQSLRQNLGARKKFECLACGKWHSMPRRGLTDNRGLQKLLRKKKVVKPLSEPASELKSLVESLPSQLRALVSFDEREHINQHCDRLEVEVIDEVASLVRHLYEIESDLLKRIDQHRLKSLESLEVRSFGNEMSGRKRTGDALEWLSKELVEFSNEWNNYFVRVDAFVTDSMIEAALNKARGFEAKMSSIERKLKMDAFDGQLMSFKASHSFLGDQDPLRKFLSLSVQKKSIRIQSTPVKTLESHSDTIDQFLFLSETKLASCSRDRTVKIWNVDEGGLFVELHGHTHFVYAIESLSNGWLATGSADHSIRLWDLDERKPVRTLHGHSGSVTSLKALKKSGNLASYSSDNTIKIWNPYSDTNSLLLSIVAEANASWFVPLAVLPDDRLVTCFRTKDHKDSKLKVWNPNDGQLVKSAATGCADITTLLVLLGGQIALGFENGIVKFFDVESSIFDWSKEARSSWNKLQAHAKAVSCLVQLSSGANFISAGADIDDDSSNVVFTIKFWNLADLSLLQTVKTGASNRINWMSISRSEDLLATTSMDNTIKLWPIVVE